MTGQTPFGFSLAAGVRNEVYWTRRRLEEDNRDDRRGRCGGRWAELPRNRCVLNGGWLVIRRWCTGVG